MSLPNSMLKKLEIYKKENEFIEKKIDLKWDFKNNDFLLNNGEVVTTNNIKEIVKQWIIKCLYVKKNVWRVYYKDIEMFGIGIYKYKGINPLFQEMAQSEIRREIITTLKNHKYIKNIENYYSSFTEDKLIFEFDVIINSTEKEILNISEVIEW